MLLGPTAAQPGTGRDRSQAPSGTAAGEPPLAKLLKKKKYNQPTSNSKTLSDRGQEGFTAARALRVAPMARTPGDRWGSLDV